jgi:hypothetical protein
MTTWEIEESAHFPSADPMCDWHAVIRLARPGDHRGALYIFMQFGSLGITEEQADAIVNATIAGLNAALKDTQP